MLALSVAEAHQVQQVSQVEPKALASPLTLQPRGQTDRVMMRAFPRLCEPPPTTGSGCALYALFGSIAILRRLAWRD
jgi:hypothetical protein